MPVSPDVGRDFRRGELTMQTQTTTETKPRDLDAEITSARAALEKLESAAQDAEAAAQRWQTAFDREPTIQSRDERDIWGQRAKNGRTAVDDYRRNVLAPLEKARREAERDTITRVLKQEQGALEHEFEMAITGVYDSAKRLDAAIWLLSDLHEKRLAAARAGAILPALSLAQIVETLNAKLAELNGTHAHEVAAKSAYLAFVDQGREAHVALTIRRPAGHVPTPVR
jgi:hypothetical protein